MNWYYFTGHSLARLAGYLWYDFQVINAERLQQNGPVLFVCNHASNFDPPMIGSALREPIWYLGKKTLFRGFGAWIYPKLQCIPVDQEGRDSSGLKNIIKLLRKGEKVLVFPEGARTLDGEMQKGELGVGLIVNKTQVPILPMKIFGTYEALPPSASFPRRSKIRLVVGQPIPFDPQWSEHADRAGYEKITAKVMQEITQLELPPGY
jgi:1-acyl-sn-glycerol-3-phosphate acyltransferase